MLNRNNVLQVLVIIWLFSIIAVFFMIKFHVGIVHIGLELLYLILSTGALALSLLHQKQAKIISRYENLESVFKNSTDMVFMQDRNFKYIFYNNFFSNIAGIKPEDAIGKRCCEIWSHDPDIDDEKLSKEVLKKGCVIKYDRKIIAADKKKYIFEITKSPMYDKSGKIEGIIGISRDVTQIREVTEAYKRVNAERQAILKYLPQYFYVKDLEGIVIFGNKALLEIYRSLGVDIVGKLSHEYLALYSNYSVEANKADDLRLLNGETDCIIKEIVVNLNGKIVYMEIQKALVLDENGNPFRILITGQDISDKKEAEKRKTNFVATLTHDLKTPIMAQIRAIELLLSGSLGKIDKQGEETLCEVLFSEKYVLHMVQSLLTTFQYEEGAKKLNFREFDFAQLIAECLKGLEILFKDKKQTISVINQLAKPLVCADRIEIKRVLMNYISNAVNYSCGDGEIEILMHNKDKKVVCEVTNSGRHIPTKEIGELFELYKSHSHKYEQVGTGLGLYYVKKVIEAHNGEVFAQSNNGRNTFGFIIPVEPEQPANTYNSEEESLKNSKQAV